MALGPFYAFIARTTANATGVNTLAVAKPAGVLPGDLLVVDAMNSAAGSRPFTAPAGFASQGEYQGSLPDQDAVATFYRIATGGEGASFTVGFAGGAGDVILVALVYRAVAGFASPLSFGTSVHFNTNSLGGIPGVPILGGDSTSLVRPLLLHYVYAGTPRGNTPTSPNHGVFTPDPATTDRLGGIITPAPGWVFNYAAWGVCDEEWPGGTPLPTRTATMSSQTGGGAERGQVNVNAIRWTPTSEMVPPFGVPRTFRRGPGFRDFRNDWGRDR